MSLRELDIETLAVGLSIAAGCKPCTRFHIGAARKLGASDSDLLGIVAATLIHSHSNSVGALALAELGSRPRPEETSPAQAQRAALLGVGLAVCHNDVESMKTAVRRARDLGAADESIMTIFGLAARIKQKAASHLDGIVADLDADAAVARAAATRCS